MRGRGSERPKPIAEDEPELSNSATRLPLPTEERSEVSLLSGYRPEATASSPRGAPGKLQVRSDPVFVVPRARFMIPPLVSGEGRLSVAASRAIDVLVVGGARSRGGDDTQAAWTEFAALTSRVIANLDRLIAWAERAEPHDDARAADLLDAKLERERIEQLRAFMRPIKKRNRRKRAPGLKE